MAKLMKSVADLGSKVSVSHAVSAVVVPPSPEVSSSPTPVDTEVVAVARRRHISPADKRRIVAAAERCTEPGEIGALLRREGIYSSQLSDWRKHHAAAGPAGLDSRKRGRQADPAIAEGHRTAKLTRENDRLRRQLTQAHLIIEVQKKVSSLLALQTADDTWDGPS